MPGFPAPFDTPAGFYWLVLAIAALVTWFTWNVARLMWGRGLIAIRDSRSPRRRSACRCSAPSSRSSSSAASPPASPARCSPSLQSYITPDTFVFELGLFFFVCIIIGGRGSIVGPLLGTVILTALPELVAPLAKLGNFFYGLLLLVVVLLVPEGIGRVFEADRRTLRGRRRRREPRRCSPTSNAARAAPSLAAGPSARAMTPRRACDDHQAFRRADSARRRVA